MFPETLVINVRCDKRLQNVQTGLGMPRKFTINCNTHRACVKGAVFWHTANSQVVYPFSSTSSKSNPQQYCGDLRKRSSSTPVVDARHMTTGRVSA